MPEIPSVTVRACLGWKLAEDHPEIVLVGLAGDGQFTVALDEKALKEVVFNLIQASSAFKKPKTQSGERLVVDAKWIDLGLSRDDKHAILDIHFSSGGEMAFRLGREMAERFLDSLETVFNLGSKGGKPKKGTH